MVSVFRVPTPAGTPVRVYRNLRPGVPTWSIQAKGRTGVGNAHRWYVVGHAHCVVLDKATFRVYEAGRQRVLATGVKNVHAYALGTLVGADDDLTLMVPEEHAGGRPRLASYNPRTHRTFTAYYETPGDVLPVHGAERAWLTATGKVWVVA